MQYIWINSKIRPSNEVYISANCLGFLLGASVFEAIRANWNSAGSYYCVNNIKSHIKRLFDSMKLMRMNTAYSQSEIEEIVISLIRFWDEKQDAYIRITAYIDSPSPGSSVFNPKSVSTNVMISITPSPITERVNEISCCCSSWRRISENSMPPRAKSACNYENTRLAGFEAILNGFDNAILLNEVGKVSEAAESAIFFFDNDSRLITPNSTSDVLCSINKSLISKIWSEFFKGDCIERTVDRTELYLAKEVFICNTAKLIRSVTDIDHIPIGNMKHPLTDKLMKKYVDVIRGNDSAFLSNSVIVNV